MPLSFQGKQYEPTAEDRLWLLRAVQAEGAPHAEVAKALVNLFAYLRAQKSYKGTLADLVRAYAQPVNPRWMQGGDLYEAAYAKAEPSARAAMKLAHDRRKKASTRTVFDKHVMVAVERALSESNASDVTDYAAPSVDATSKGYTARGIQRAGQNRFWTRAVGWTGYLSSGSDANGGLIVALVIMSALMLRKGVV